MLTCIYHIDINNVCWRHSNCVWIKLTLIQTHTLEGKVKIKDSLTQVQPQPHREQWRGGWEAWDRIGREKTRDALVRMRWIATIRIPIFPWGYKLIQIIYKWITQYSYSSIINLNIIDISTTIKINSNNLQVNNPISPSHF